MTETKEQWINDDQAKTIGRAAVKGFGIWLIWRGARQPGLLGALAAGAGAFIAFPKAMNELCEYVKELTACDASGSASSGSDAESHGQNSDNIDAPSGQDADRTASQKPEDEVELAGMESFPASDPPGSYQSTGGR